jgi:lipid A 3-O-deacylase
MRSRRLSIACFWIILAGGLSPAFAGQLSVLEENDSLFFSSDKHYTQGLRLNDLSDPLRDGWRYNAFDFFNSALPLFPAGAGGQRRFDWIVIGQSIFTPMNLHLNPPNPTDRPYAGWLYTGASLMEENAGSQLTNLELLVGIVGPAALGEPVQNDWHQFVVGIPGGAGWNNQLKNEPGLALSHEKRWRLSLASIGGVGIDAVPELGITVGNIFTYASAGAILRLGNNLAADYGSVRIRPAPSGTDWFDSAKLMQPLGWYVFAGGEGRAVGHNIFLDGNTFASSGHVNKKLLVDDLTAGVALFWKDAARLDVGLLSRSKEFYGQQGQDSYAGFRFSFGL